MAIDSLTIAASAIILGFVAFALPTTGCLKVPPFLGLLAKPHPLVFYLSFLGSLTLLLYWVNQRVLLGFMNSGDEHSCYFLAECIRKLRFWVNAPDHYEFFEVVHVGVKEGKWFSVYPPGWPLLFALGLSVGLGNWINPFLTALAVLIFLAIGRRLYGSPAAWLGILLMISTPFFLLNGASYMSHPTCLLMGAIFLWTYMRWVQTEHVVWAFLCALSFGYGLGTRYLTMAAIGVPIVFYELFRILTGKARATRKSYVIFALTLGLIVFLILYYNYLITGNFFEAPNHYYHSWERLGFHSDYTPIDALRFLYRRLLFLMDWSAPTLLGFYLLGLMLIRIQNGFDGLFRFGFFYVALAYLFYYSWGGNQYGPRYYFEGFPFLTLFAGHSVHVWWTNGSEKLRKFLFGLVLVSIAGNLYFVAKFGHFWHVVSFERKALYRLAEQKTEKPALVFIRGYLGDKLVMAEEDAIRNPPALDAPVLYAHDLGQKNRLLMQGYPERSYYLGSYDRQAKEARLEALSVVQGGA